MDNQERQGETMKRLAFIMMLIFPSYFFAAPFNDPTDVRFFVFLNNPGGESSEGRQLNDKVFYSDDKKISCKAISNSANEAQIQCSIKGIPTTIRSGAVRCFSGKELSKEDSSVLFFSEPKLNIYLGCETLSK